MSSIKYCHPAVCKKLDQLAKLDKSKSWVLPYGSRMTPKTNVWATLTIPNCVFIFVSKHTGILLQ